MTSIRTLSKGVIILGLALSSAACASMPEASAPMLVGARAAAPHGFVEFCERQPTDCGVSPAELAQLRANAAGSFAGHPVAAISFNWTTVFPPKAPASTPVQTNGVTYDWSGAFAKLPSHHTRTAIVADRPGQAPLPMSSTTWALLTRTNDLVNRAMVERTDQQIYGVSEYWGTPLKAGLKVGDCEDYALEKRRALLAAGLPASSLSIAVVTTQQGQDHAVLLVATDKGEYVLDNLSAWVLPWNKVPYQWRERQVAGSASQWAFAALPALTSSSNLLLATAR